MKFLNLSVLLLFLTACDNPSSHEQSAKAVIEEAKDVFDLNNKDAIDEAVMMDRLQVRGKLTYIPNTEEPYNGLAKSLFDNGQLQFLIKFNNGYISAVKSWRTDGSAQKYFEVDKLNYDVDDFVDDFGERGWKDDSYPFWTEGTKIFRKVVLWHENNQVSRVQLCTSEGEGIGEIVYFKNGQKSIQTEWKEGLVWNAKAWKPNGEPAEEAVLNGNGKLNVYAEGGGILTKTIYKNGKLDGEHITYTEDGNISYKGTLKDGKLNGEVIFYNDDGSIFSKKLYKDGEIIESPLK